VVVEGKTIIFLRAPAGQDIGPPRSGWTFWNKQKKEHEADPGLSCSPATHSPCSITVTLTGKARHKVGECGGEYQPVETWSAGRQVGTGSGPSIHLAPGAEEERPGGGALAHSEGGQHRVADQ
jgi:hypothetical protein